ncbi:TLR4 interactor with leucine rich repeats-like [Lutzomyia longipalpis]|uniref:TLR4 interactor with leucine rich repeats-like n=1 Tax=Lutzomyia longipalpis TaxID=7200 RepID=UPI00248439FA|nr:TLR4 interactor with leucine rich repeats-like [Lutzomyia longipalpis]
MTGNRIKKIGQMDFERLTKLQQLYLDNNEIATIEEGAFEALKALEVLILANNLLFRLPGNLFDQQSKLVILWLSGNNMVYFPIPGWNEETGEISSTSTLGKLRKLHIDMNPLQCQCVDLIKSWAKLKNIRLGIDNDYVKNGLQPACIINDQGCRTDIGKDFIHNYWHLFNNETYINMLYKEEDERSPAFWIIQRVFESLFDL